MLPPLAPANEEEPPEDDFMEDDDDDDAPMEIVSKCYFLWQKWRWVGVRMGDSRVGYARRMGGVSVAQVNAP